MHNRLDTRVAVKEAVTANSLSGRGALLVADGKGSGESAYGYRIIDIGDLRGRRIRRALVGTARVIRTALAERPRVVHFHDPELILAGCVLQLMGFSVIYDVHEDVPLQIMEKSHIPKLLRNFFARAAQLAEWSGGRIFSAIVTATPTISAKFPSAKTVTVQNFPILSELAAATTSAYGHRAPNFVYVGSITRIRGAREMVAATGRVAKYRETKLLLAGRFSPPELFDACRADTGWRHVDFSSWADRPRVVELLSQVRAGLVLLHPTQFYPDAYPVKMFEYMAAALPVIASDFPLWRRIVTEADCGVLVDPLDPDAIAGAMAWILDNPREAEAMGKRGRAAAMAHYSWETEERKLVELYGKLLETVE
ncbi:MAG: glycosyltransferase family 4 protein [Gammaproteobacteria bacterium]